MKVEAVDLPGVLLITPDVYSDERGWFLENWRLERYREHGMDQPLVQANSSRSSRGVLRGLHFQWPRPQGKLVWASQGRVFDVAVDIRPQSPSFRRWFGVELDDQRHQQLWIPEGFAHGFQVLSEIATFNYLCTEAYRPDCDAAIAWNDPDIAIDWPLAPAGMSPKDAAAPRLAELPDPLLPR